MTTIIQVLMVFYGSFVVCIGIFRPKLFWEMKKIQLFRDFLGDNGTTIFFVIWGGGFIVAALLWVLLWT